jgi:hypothetical protein
MEETEQEGKIITPLPPSKVHKTPGVVTPKSPLEFDRQYAKQLKEELPTDPQNDE